MSSRRGVPRGGGHCIDEEAVLYAMKEILTGEPNRGLPSEPSQLLGHVYLGSQSNAESLKLLRKLGVTHVLNCAGYKGPRPKPEMSPYEGLGIDYYEFQAEDRDDYDITRHFGEAFRFLDTVKKKRGVALVHCYLGINRSSATCVAYMMVANNWTLLQAVKLLKQKRRICLSNKGFQRQLVRYARMKNLLDQGVTVDNGMPSLSLRDEWDSPRRAKPPKPRSYSETVTASSPRHRPVSRGRLGLSSDSSNLYSVGSEPIFSSKMYLRQETLPPKVGYRRERLGSLPSVHDPPPNYRTSTYKPVSVEYLAARARSPSPARRAPGAGRPSSRDRSTTTFYGTGKMHNSWS